jgi:hypothetical protein
VVRRALAFAASLAPASLLALSLAACSDILGLKDLELYPAEGGADSGEDASPDGTSGSDTGTTGTDASGDAPGNDARDSESNDTTGGDGPATDSSDMDSSSIDSTAADVVEDTAHPADAPVDTSAGSDGACSPDLQTDAHNCGACGHDCLKGTCDNGYCQAFAIGSSVTAYDMVVSSGTLYWVDQASTVWTCTITGNACSPHSFAINQSSPERITLGGSANGTVFWTNFGSGGAADGSIVSLPLAGGTPSTVVSGRWTPQGIAADDTYVFWAESSQNQLLRRPLGGGTTTTLSTGTSSDPTAVAVGAGTVYWTDSELNNMGSVLMSPENTLTATGTVQGSQDLPQALAVDSTYVYWVDFEGTGAVWQYTINGGQKQQVGTGDSNPFRVVSDPSSAFWIDQGTPADNGEVVEWHVATNSPTVRAMNLDQPSALAMDASAVYFATLGGTLYMMVR